MFLRYLLPVILLLCGCQQNADFLGQFRNKGEFVPECIGELDGNSTVNMISMLKSGDYIVWTSYHAGKGTVLYAYDLHSDSLAGFLLPLKDSAHTCYPEKLYPYRDSVVMSFNEVYQYFSYIHLKDSFYIVGYQNLVINNEEFFDWKGKAVMRFVCPGKDSLLLVGCIGTKTVDYGVYDCNSRFLYPSHSCVPPTVSEMKCLLPDYKDNISVVRQKGKNKFAVFRRYYQLYDIINMNETALQLMKRNVYHHSLLTWEDQYNLQQDLTHPFFPGFFIQSSQFIATLYQSQEKEKKSYLLVWDWNGNPLYSYCFPLGFKVYGLCGNKDGIVYVAGRTKQGKVCLFKIIY